jgi:hypothetical protein
MATGFMMTAEIPLLETEVPGFLLAAKENSLAVAAIHNHVIGESPRVIFVHLEAVNSDPAMLATHILAALQTTIPSTTSDFVPSTPNGSSSSGLSSQVVATDIAPNATGSILNNVIDVEVPRSESFYGDRIRVTEHASGSAGRSWAAQRFSFRSSPIS